MAGSNSQAIAEVLPATKIEKMPDKRILSRFNSHGYDRELK